MILLRRAVAFPAGLAGVVLLAGCGSSSGSLLSPAAASQLTSDLNQASHDLAGLDCSAAYTAIANFRNDVAAVRGANSTLLTVLNQGASTINSLAAQRCPSGSAPEPRTRTVTTSSTATSTTTPTSSTTAAPTTTSTPTVPTSGGAAPSSSTTPSAPTATTPATAPTPTTATQATTAPASGGAGIGTVAAGSGGAGG